MAAGVFHQIPLLLKASVDSVSVWMLSLMTEKAISPSGTTSKK